MYDDATVETIEHAGCTIRIQYDFHADHCNPADEDGFLSTVVHTSNRYNICGFDRTDLDYVSPSKPCGDCDGSGYKLDDSSEDCPTCEGYGEVEATWEEWLRAEHNIIGPILNLYMYEHGRVIYKASEGGNVFTCPWDSGQTGWVFWTRDKVEAMGAPTDDEQIAKGIKAEIDEYSDWANGNVYGYTVECDGEEVDACWGFIGDEGEKYAIEQAKDHAECYEQKAQEEAAEAEYWKSRDVETVGA